MPLLSGDGRFFILALAKDDVRLFEATRDIRYRNAALDWAKKNQAFQPWFACSKVAHEGNLVPSSLIHSALESIRFFT